MKNHNNYTNVLILRVEGENEIFLQKITEKRKKNRKLFFEDKAEKL